MSQKSSTPKQKHFAEITILRRSLDLLSRGDVATAANLLSVETLFNHLWVQ